MPSTATPTQLDPQTNPSTRGWFVPRFVQLVYQREVLALFDQGMISASNFFTNWMVANAMSVDAAANFGVFLLAISLVQFVRGAQEQLVSAPYTIYRFRSSSPAQFAGSALIHQLVLTAMALLIFAALPSILPAQLNTVELRMALRCLLIVAPFFLFREYARKLLFAHLDFSAAVCVDVCVSGVQLSLLAILAAAGKLTVVNAFLCIAVAAALGITIWVWRYRIPQRFDVSAIVADWRTNWRFGRWALATHVIGSSTPYFVPWMVAYLSNASVTGRFGVCMTLVGLGNMVLVGVSNYLHPQSAEAYAVGGVSRLRSLLAKAVVFFVVTLGSLCLVLVFLGDKLPSAIFGSEFMGLGTTLVLLAIGLLAGALGMVAGNGIWAMDRPALNLTADVTCLLLTFGLGWMWIPTQFAEGAARAVMTGALAAAGVRWIIFSLLMRRPPLVPVPSPKCGRPHV